MMIMIMMINAKKSISRCLSASSRRSRSSKNDCHQFSFIDLIYWCKSETKSKPKINTPKYLGSCFACLETALVNSDVRAVRLETASVDSHMLSRSVASCTIFHLWTLFNYINSPGCSCMFRLLGLKLRSEKSVTFFRPNQGLLQHTQASQGSLNRRWSIDRWIEPYSNFT